MTRLLALILAVAALGLVAVGCGGDDDDDGENGAADTAEQPAPADTGAADTEEDGGAAAGGGGAVELSSPADGSLEYDTTEVSADAGEVTIEFTNNSEDVPHNVTLEDPQAATETVTGDTTSVTTELQSGEYTFFCSVGNHRQAGMEGTLTVE